MNQAPSFVVDFEEKTRDYLKEKKPDLVITSLLKRTGLIWKAGHLVQNGLPIYSTYDISTLDCQPLLIRDLIGQVRYSKRYDVVQYRYETREGIDNLVVTATPCLDKHGQIHLEYQFTHENGRLHQITIQKTLAGQDALEFLPEWLLSLVNSCRLVTS